MGERGDSACFGLALLGGGRWVLFVVLWKRAKLFRARTCMCEALLSGGFQDGHGSCYWALTTRKPIPMSQVTEWLD